MSFTTNLENFLDNNQPGGYITTSVSISNNDLDARINQTINNKGFLTSNSHIPWTNIDNKPTLFSGNYNDLTNKPTLFSGSYNDLTNKPNLSANGGDIRGLAKVATTGSYDDLNDLPVIITSYNDLSDTPTFANIALSGEYNDLNNKYYIFNPSEFINYYDSDTEQWSTISNSAITLCGIANDYIKNIDNLYIQQDLSSKSFIDELNILLTQFNTRKPCYLSVNYNYMLITNVKAYYNNNNEIISMNIEIAPNTVTNLNTDLTQTVITNNDQIVNIYNDSVIQVYQPLIVIDLVNNLLFSIRKRIYPAYGSDTIDVNNYNVISAKISSNENNQLTINDTDGEQGLYV